MTTLTHRRGFVLQSGGSSVAALVAMLSGLVLDVALALRFGAGRQSDAFFVAARIPIGLCAVLMTVATQALVPLFTRERRSAGPHGLATFASRTTSAAFLGGAVLWAAASLLAHPLVALTAPGLDGAQRELAASMVPAMFLVVPLVAAAETVRAALNASYAFVLPAAMNLFMNGLTAGLVLADHGRDIRAVAWAYVAGAAFQLVVITALAWWHGLRVLPSWRLADARVRAAVRLSGRPTVSSLLNLGNRVAEQLLVSFLPAGSITVLSYGQRLISALGGGVFFRPVTVALLPRLADAEHAGDEAAVGRLVRRGLRFVLAISLPLTAFTVALADPVVRVVFHRGSFGPAATHLLALTLAIYGASLVGSGVQRVLLAPFYARLDTWTPLRNTFYGVVVDLALLPVCVGFFGRDDATGVLGVAVAYSVTQYVIVAHAWNRLRRTVPLQGRTLVGFVVRATVAAAAGVTVMLGTVRLPVFEVSVAQLDRSGRTQLAVATALAAVVGALVMAVAAVLLFGPRRTLGRLRRTGEPGSAASAPDERAASVHDEPAVEAAGPAAPAVHPLVGADPEAGPLMHQMTAEPAVSTDPPPLRTWPLLLAGAPAVLLVAVATGMLAVHGVGRTELVIPLGTLVGLALVVVGTVRFEWLVLAVLALRTVVDVSKPGTDAAAPASSAATGANAGSGLAATALAGLFVAMAVVWLFVEHRRGRGLRPTPADGAFALFVVSCILSVVGSVNRSASVVEVGRVVAAVLMFVVLERLLTDMARVRRVLVAAFVALAAPVGLALYQAASGHGQFVTGGVSRVVGTFLHPNTLGFFLSMFMLMAVALYRHCEPRVRLALAGVIAVCTPLLVLTYSRGSWIALVLGLVIVGALQSRAVFVWMAVGLAVAVAALPTVVSRVSDLGAGTTVTGSAGNSLTWRLDYWASVVQLNHANPVTGIGLKGTRFITDQSKAPHNDFLRAYAETGALGLLAFLTVLAAMVGIARSSLRRAEAGLARGVAVGFVAVLAAYVVDSLGDNLMSEIVVLWYFYAFAACAFAVSRLSSDARGAPGRPARLAVEP